MIIGFNGLKHSGKTTAADYLIEEYGFEPVSFARPMKDSMAAFLNVNKDHMEAVKDSPFATIVVFLPATDDFPYPVMQKLSMRVGMQRYGTEAHRLIPEFGLNVWSDMAEDKLSADKNLVVADCRFDNEAVVIHRCGGKIVKVVRDAVVSGDEHASEAGISPMNIDLFLSNNDRIDDLFDRLDLLVRGLVS
jgi:hypothetical protein